MPSDQSGLEEGRTEQRSVCGAAILANSEIKITKSRSLLFMQAFNLEEKTAIIGGTWYGGEMKKVSRYFQISRHR